MTTFIWMILTSLSFADWVTCAAFGVITAVALVFSIAADSVQDRLNSK